jgi:hypothetical protein
MNTDDAIQWLEGELQGFPSRADGAELYRFFIRIVRQPLENVEERPLLIDALRHWLSLRSEPRTMLAVEIASVFQLSELRVNIEGLLEDIKSGKSFQPFYARGVLAALQQICKKTG